MRNLLTDFYSFTYYALELEFIRMFIWINKLLSVGEPEHVKKYKDPLKKSYRLPNTGLLRNDHYYQTAYPKYLVEKME